MKGYLSIPPSIYCECCKICGTRPVIAVTATGYYLVKCPCDENHYQTQPGLIDIENWNLNNTAITQPITVNAQLSH